LRIDSRLVGETSENVFLSLMNQRGIFAHSFDTAGFDGIVFDLRNKYFKVGSSPFFVQIKCRGSKTNKYNAQGHPRATIEKITDVADRLNISEQSLYFVVGFFKNDDVRQMKYYIVPFASLRRFENRGHYRFWPDRCDDIMSNDPNITSI
jgi:hypothetical protein